MEKNRVKLNICGTDYIVTSESSEEYMISVGQEVDSKLRTILEKNPRLSVSMASVLIALDYCDETKKANESADHLRSQIKQYLDESTLAQMELEEAQSEIENLRTEIQKLRMRLADSDNLESNTQKNSSQHKNEYDVPISKIQEEEYSSSQVSLFVPNSDNDETEDIMKFFENRSCETAIK